MKIFCFATIFAMVSLTLLAIATLPTVAALVVQLPLAVMAMKAAIWLEDHKEV